MAILPRKRSGRPIADLHPVSGVIVGTRSVSLTGIVQVARSMTSSIDAQVQASTAVTTLMQGAVQSGRLATALVGAGVSTPVSASSPANAAVLVVPALTSLVGSVVQEPRSATAVVSAQVQAGQGQTTQINAYIQEGGVLAASVSAAVARLLLSQSATLGAMVQADRLVATALATAVSMQAISTALLSSAIAVRIGSNAGLSAYIEDGSVVSELDHVRLASLVRQAHVEVSAPTQSIHADHPVMTQVSLVSQVTPTVQLSSPVDFSE